MNMTPKSAPINGWFRAATALSAVFVVTILALVAVTFGGSNSPAAQFLNKHGTTVIAVEVAAILACGVRAISAERRQNRRQADESVKGSTAAEPPANTNEPRG